MASKQRRESFWPRNDNRKADEANQDLSPPRRTRTLLSTNLDVQNFSKPGPLQLKMHDKSPWADHTRVMTTNQAGPGIIAAHTANRNMKRVVIKEAEGYGKDALHRLRTISSEHLVQFRAAYYYSNSIFIVYEPMEVSLNDILVTPKGRLPYTEIATVCKSILNGLQYLHKELLMECGCIDGSNVLLTGVGQVKIANIAQRMLRPTSEPDFQEDLKALGGLVVQIMEPAILTVNPPRQQLEGLHEDSEDLVDFLQKIVFSTCKDLLEHAFLNRSRGHHHLGLYVWPAAELREREVEVFSDIL